MTTAYHAQYWAHLLTLKGSGDSIAALSRSISNARLDLNPHQVDAALFALRSPLSHGAILADEVGLGKTIEAGIILAQRWAEPEEDFSVFDEAAEEWDDEPDPAVTATVDPKLLKEELAELRSFAALAERITANAKGSALLAALSEAFTHTDRIGAARKAVVFTESRRTQKYLFDLLTANGYAGKVVLISGTNDDAASKAVYQAWLQRRAGQEIITGNPAVDLKAALVEEFRAQGELPGFARELDLAKVVEKTVDSYIRLSIDIPRIIVVPVGDVSGGFRDFDLDLNDVHLQPVADDILIQHLRTHERSTLGGGAAAGAERRPEDYLVSALMDFNDVSYDDHAQLLYKLAGQAVARLRSYLKDEAEVRNVLQYHRRALAERIHADMEKHYEEKATAYEAHVSRGFRTLRPGTYTAAAGEAVRDFRDPVDEKQLIRGMLFGGFSRCLYPLQKFDSDTERRFAILLENPDEPVVKWFKPASGDLRIGYRADADYEPDFVVETTTAKWLCEPKARGEMNDPEVQAKARAAALWCRHATEHELKHGGKPWSYMLIPHDEVTASKTLAGLAASWTL